MVANQSSQKQHQEKKQSEKGAPEVDSYLVVFDFITTRSTSKNTALNRRFIQGFQRGKRPAYEPTILILCFRAFR
jgi:hypothetical protein